MHTTLPLHYTRSGELSTNANSLKMMEEFCSTGIVLERLVVALHLNCWTPSELSPLRPSSLRQTKVELSSENPSVVYNYYNREFELRSITQKQTEPGLSACMSGESGSCALLNFMATLGMTLWTNKKKITHNQTQHTAQRST